MKKTTALICLLAMSSFIYSQDTQKKFQLGFHFSPNVSWLKADSETLESDGAKLGFSYGVVADFNIAENYAISTGINLLTSGIKMNYPDFQDVNNQLPGEESGRTSVNMNFRYIQLPIALKLKTNQIGYMRYFGQFGLAAGFAYDAAGDTDFEYSGSTGTTSKEDVNLEGITNFFRGSLIVGLGAEYNISGNTSILSGLTYDNGLTNIFSEDGYNEDDNGNAENPKDENIKGFNNSIVLNLGILF